MGMYRFEVSVPGDNEQEAAEKLKCIAVFMKKFKTHELKKFAEVAEKEPAKIAFAKKALGL